MYRNYTNYNFQPYNPKKAIKSFQDLEVYQKALEGSVFVGKTVMEAYTALSVGVLTNRQSARKKSAGKKISPAAGTIDLCVASVRAGIVKNAVICALSIPHEIAEAHSVRFGESDECLKILDKVMLNCNKMIVYLEQIRDICGLGLEPDQFNDQINKYQYLRRKVLNLQRVWRKYIQIEKKEKAG